MKSWKLYIAKFHDVLKGNEWLASVFFFFLYTTPFILWYDPGDGKITNSYTNKSEYYY